MNLEKQLYQELVKSISEILNKKEYESLNAYSKILLSKMSGTYFETLQYNKTLTNIQSESKETEPEPVQEKKDKPVEPLKENTDLDKEITSTAKPTFSSEHF